MGFFGGGKLKTIHADGGPLQVVCDVTSARGGAWGKDGTIVYTSSIMADGTKFLISSGNL